MDRISILCTYLDKSSTFADVACDHGYCAQYMLENNMCKSAVISDISDKCLKKAETLLSEYIKTGVCRAVCCDGLEGVDGQTEQILIAGIGGEEIVKILKNAFIPKAFVFQPMKNAEVVREYLLENGCALTVDGIFTDGKNYYFIIKGKNCGGEQTYTKAELLYGRDSLKSPVFKNYLKEQIEKKRAYLMRDMTDEHRKRLEADLSFMQGVLYGEID